VAIELLVRRLTLPRTVTMVPGVEFSGSNGDTITVRVPQPTSARKQASRGAELTADDINEVPVSVTLSHLYHLKNLSDQEVDFDLENFARQITRPQVEAVAIKAEAELASVMNALSASSTIEWDLTPAEADDKATILAAREFLGGNEVPPEDRYLAVAPDIASRLLGHDFFTKVNESGSSDALRNARIGRVFGFEVLESNALSAGTAIAYHKSAFVFATKVPSNPKGAASSAGTVGQGIGLRQVFQYDAGTAQDQSLVSTYGGAAAVYEDESGTDEARFVKIGIGT
jgi:hypothetical protein